MDEVSNHLTTFTTIFGWFWWKVLPFGTAPALEIFQKVLYNNEADLKGVVNKADDLVVGKGKTMEEAMVDHDKKLRKLLQRCHKHRMQINAEKMDLRQTSLSFIGHIVTSEVLLPEPEKVKAIKEMPCPTDVKEIQC